MKEKENILDTPEGLASLSLQKLPLGHAFPPSPHTVFASLPTMDSIIGYEEKDKKVIESMQGGYPRFVNPKYTRMLEASLWEEIQKGSGIIEKGGDISEFIGVRLISSHARAKEAVEYVQAINPKSKIEISKIGTELVTLMYDHTNKSYINDFLQHTGSMLFSREAQTHLIQRKLLVSMFPEARVEESKETLLQKIKNVLGQEIELKELDNLYVTRSGMSALYAVLQSVRKVQVKKKRTLWIQLGWLYIDTSEYLKKFLGAGEECIFLESDLDGGDSDVKKLESIMRERGEEVIAVMTEIPNNPLLHTADILKVRELCLKYGAALILDPSMMGLGNIKILEHCDALSLSLTKYYAWSGDVIMGACALNPAGPMYEALNQEISHYIEVPFIGDMERMVYVLKNYPRVMQKINENMMEFIKFLEKQKNVRRIHWAFKESSKKKIEPLIRSSNCPGGVLSFELENISLKEFYDAIEIPKGPSFGLAFTLLSPYMYLAHYDLVSTSNGRSMLKKIGLDPNLVRVSLGIEDIDSICKIFYTALNK